MITIPYVIADVVALYDSKIIDREEARTFIGVSNEEQPK